MKERRKLEHNKGIGVSNADNWLVTVASL